MDAIRTLLLTALLGLTRLCAWSQAYCPQWISAPPSYTGSVLWFHKTFVVSKPLRQARLMVATGGKVKVYVCEANVGRALFYPSRQPGDGRPVTLTWDVTPYLRPDTIVVAVAYCPPCPGGGGHQVAACLYGTDVDGKPVSFVTNESWLCRPANTLLTDDGHEITDGRRHNTSWKSTTPQTALWTGCLKDSTGQGQNSFPPDYSTTLPAEVLTHVWRSKYFDVSGDSAQYEFGTAFHGMTRLTLREARPGETICYDGNTYVCSGEMDEQACPLFTTGTHRRVHVTGDNGFKRDHIVDMEALETTDKSMDNVFY